jgi:phosphoglycolate phosphatase
MSAYDLVIFDLDGTLIDSKLDLAHSVNASLAHMGRDPLTHDRVYSYVGNGAPVLMRRALGEDASEAEVDKALEYFLAYYDEHKLDFTALYPGVHEALSALHAAGVRMAVLTNKPVKMSREIIDGLGLASWFFQVYGGNSFGQKKPDPVGILTLLEEAKLSRENALMVGDSSVDIQTARNAGVAAVGCAWGFQPETLTTPAPDWLIGNMGELNRIVQEGARAASNVII